MKIALTGMNWVETDSVSDGPQTHQPKTGQSLWAIEWPFP